MGNTPGRVDDAKEPPLGNDPNALDGSESRAALVKEMKRIAQQNPGVARNFKQNAMVEYVWLSGLGPLRKPPTDSIVDGARGVFDRHLVDYAARCRGEMKLDDLRRRTRHIGRASPFLLHAMSGAKTSFQDAVNLAMKALENAYLNAQTYGLTKYANSVPNDPLRRMQLFVSCAVVAVVDRDATRYASAAMAHLVRHVPAEVIAERRQFLDQGGDGDNDLSDADPEAARFRAFARSLEASDAERARSTEKMVDAMPAIWQIALRTSQRDHATGAAVFAAETQRLNAVETLRSLGVPDAAIDTAQDEFDAVTRCDDTKTEAASDLMLALQRDPTGAAGVLGDRVDSELNNQAI